MINPKELDTLIAGLEHAGALASLGRGRMYLDAAAALKSLRDELLEAEQTVKIMHGLYKSAEADLKEAESKITIALACYGSLPDTMIGRSRWRSADEFLVAIYKALTSR